MVSISSQKDLKYFLSINKTSEKIDKYLKYKLIDIILILVSSQNVQIKSKAGFY